MRPNGCCSNTTTNNNYLFHRTHYCGTCKAIGNEFNHQSRMLLNFDTVFLSELLSLLNEVSIASWENNLQQVNTCWSMPKEDLPFSLQYAAAVSVLLGELKMDDQVKDHNLLRWKIVKRFYSKSFQLATKKFEAWDIDTTPIYDWVDVQAERETEKVSFGSLEACLNFYAEATAQITGQLFEAGGQKTLAGPPLFDLGYSFGKLMYVLDAFEDYERDVFQQQFNPLAVYWGDSRFLSPSQLEEVRTIIITIQEKVNLEFSLLPIEAEMAGLYQERLGSNLALRLYRERIVPTTFKEQIVQRWDFAKEFASQISCQPQSFIRQLNYYMIVLAVFISPQTSEYLPSDGKMEVFKWTALIMAFLAGLGIAGVIRRKSKKEQRLEKRKENRFKRFYTKLKNILLRKDSCCSSCCSSCCDSCCNSCCQNICESENPWFWILIILALILTAALVVLILFLAGVL